MLDEPFKFNLNLEDVLPEIMASYEAEAEAVMGGPLKKAFEESFNLMISSLVAIPLSEKDRIIAMVAQIKGLIHVHENMKDMIASQKMRVAESKYDSSSRTASGKNSMP